MLHRLGLEYHKPNVIPRKLDEEKQKAFIEGYEKLLNSLGDDEAVRLRTPCIRPCGAACRLLGAEPREARVEQRAGATHQEYDTIDLETGQTRMIEALTIDAASTIRLLQSIEALYPMLALIHVFLDNARYHHAKPVEAWLALRDDASSCTSFQRIARTCIRPAGWGVCTDRHSQQVIRSRRVRRCDAQFSA